MSVKAAKASEAPVTEWETFEGVTYGTDEEGDQVVEIDARTPISEHVLDHENNVRGWAVWNADRSVMKTGSAIGLREAKAAALAALRAL